MLQFQTVVFVVFLVFASQSLADPANAAGQSERALKRCSNPPYVQCGQCSSKPWSTLPSNSSSKAFRLPMDNNLRDLRTYNPGALIYYQPKNSSYDMSGNTTVQCLQTGMWSPAPTCIYYCTSPPAVVNATCTQPATPFKADDKASCQCNQNYVRQTGFSQPKCKTGNQWSAPLVCRPQQSACTDLPTISMATCTALTPGQTSWQKGDEISCTCANGYEDVSGGNNSIRALASKRTTTSRSRGGRVRDSRQRNAKCDGSNKWIRLPTCQLTTTTPAPVTCLPPPAVDNAGCPTCGQQDSSGPVTFQVGDSVVFNCNDGYTMNGSSTITCQSTGLWTALPICVQNQGCDTTPVITLGVCDPDNPLVGTNGFVALGGTATCQCDGQLVLVGSQTITCLTGNSWSALPSCRTSAMCQLSDLGNPTHGHCRSAWFDGATQFNTGDQVACLCDSGFYVSPASGALVTCNADGTWSAATPSCAPVRGSTSVTCSLPEIDNGYCQGDEESSRTSFSIGDTISCFCSANYRLTGDAVIQCTTPLSSNSKTAPLTASWSVLPSCVANNNAAQQYGCAFPKKMQCSGGTPFGTMSGNSVTDCNCVDNYVLQNPRQTAMTCQADESSSQWTPALKCVQPGGSTLPATEAPSTTTEAPATKSVAPIKQQTASWVNSPQCGTRNLGSNNNKLGQSGQSKLVEISRPVTTSGQHKLAQVPQEKPATNGASTRIVNGVNALVNEFPWQARIEVNGFLCGGSLISNKWVITAAHCIAQDVTEGQMATVYLGSQDLFTPVSGEINQQAVQMIQHPQYDPDTHYNDIALIQLSSAVTFTNTIRPICLMDSDCSGEAAPGTQCIISGWGTTNENQDYATEILQKAYVPFVNESECQRAFTANGKIDQFTDGQVCAGYITGGTDTCQGDSGGPLACFLQGENSAYYLHGATSYGYGCADAGLYGVYTRPCFYMEWIKTTVAGSSASLLGHAKP